FFYENVSPRLRGLAPALRAFAMIGLFTAAHVAFLGGLWPHAVRSGHLEERLLLPYLSFTTVTLSLLGLAAAGARPAILSREPVLRLGPLTLGRFAVLFLLFGIALLIPPGLFGAAARATLSPTAPFDWEKARSLYAIVAVYAGFIFSLALVLALVTT